MTLRWPARALLLLLPLHLVAFVALFWRYQHDLLDAHFDGARLVLDQTMAIIELHPAMMSGDGAHLETQLNEVKERHGLEGLMLFDTDLNTLGSGRMPPEAANELQRFLAEREVSTTWLEKVDDTDLLHGLSAIPAEPECLTCHQAPNGIVGVAMTSWNVTSQLSSLRDELVQRSGAVIIAWVLAFGVTTLLSRRAQARSVASLEAGLLAAESGAAPVDEPRSNLALDPRSADLHERLRRFLRRQHDRDKRVVSRMQHAERLASVGQLSAGLAHEIKNPLAGISGALELLRDGDFDGSPEELYGRMLEELKRVDGIVKSLLEYGRPAKPRPASVDAAQLVREVVELLKPSLQRRNITLQAEAVVEPLHVHLDTTQIKQVLVNLITNAAEATGKDGRIVVNSTVVSNSPSTLVIAVRDDGPGLPEQDRERVFTPFFTTKLSGTGLGLPIAKSIVEQHGGDLDVDSQPGEGTTFAIVLPVVDPSDPATPPES